MWQDVAVFLRERIGDFLWAAFERVGDFFWEAPAHKPKTTPSRLLLHDDGTVIHWFCEVCRDQSGGLRVGRSSPPPGLGEEWAVDYCSECDRNHALPESLAEHLLLDANYDLDRLPSWSQRGTVFWDGTYRPFVDWARSKQRRLATDA